jgi:hypothetical protein
VVTHHVEPWRRDQRGKLTDKVHRIERDMRGSVAVRVPEGVRDPAIGKERQALRSDRRAGNLTAEPFQSPTVPGGDRDVRVETHAGEGGAARA